MVALSKFEWLVLAMALLLLPGTPWGAEPEAAAGATASSASLFERLDKNRDGYLTPNELASDEAKNGNWIAIDRDRDGKISRQEFSFVRVHPTLQPSAAAGGTKPPK